MDFFVLFQGFPEFKAVLEITFSLKKTKKIGFENEKKAFQCLEFR